MSKRSLINNWYTRPDSSHLVEFYLDDSALIDNLEEYIGSGLSRNETCVIIATMEHIALLNTQLEARLDLRKAQASGLYIALDAAIALQTFMVDGLPDKELFGQNIGGLVRRLTAGNKPLRAYGEMVALLWKDGNKEAVIQLEELWNGLAENYDFSLYCAYPELHFIMDPDIKHEINGCHNLNAHQFAAS